MNGGYIILSNAKEGEGWRVLEPGTLEMLFENAFSTAVHDSTGKDIDFNIVFFEG